MRFDGPSDPIVTSRSALEAAAISVGDSFDSLDDFMRQIAAVEVDAAMQRAFDVISRRELSHAMLERRLRDDGYSIYAVQRVVDRVAELGYLDDFRYAKLVWRAEDAANRGAARVVQKLRAAGIDAQIIEAAGEECRADNDLQNPLCAARQLAVRWGAPFSDRTTRQKAIRRIVSRGYSLDIAIRACDGSDLDGNLD